MNGLLSILRRLMRAGCRDDAESRQAHALAESEEALRRAQAVARLGSWRLDLAGGRGLTWSDETYRIFGVSNGIPLSYEDFLDRVHPEDRAAVDAAWQAALRGADYDIRHRIVVDGEVRWVHEQAELAFDERGNLAAGIGTVQEITEAVLAEQSLRSKEERFRLLFENMSLGAVVYEAVEGGGDFVFRDLNRAVERIENIGRAELIGRRVTDAFPGVREFGLLEVFSRVWRSGNPEQFPIRFYQDSRIAGWRENFVYRLSSGELVAVYDDVTAGKKAEEALRLSEERFRGLFERTNAGIAFSDPEGVLIDANASFCELIDTPIEELRGKRFTTISHPDDLALELPLFQGVAAGRRDGYRLEKRYFTRDGDTVWTDTAITVIRGEGGEILNFIGVIVDISARKQSELEYEAIVDTTRDGFWVLDMEGRIVDVNRAYCDQIGYSREELLTMRVADVELVESTEETRRHIETILANGSDRFETRHRHRDGHPIDFDVSVNYMPFAGGSMVAFLRDISQRKRAEADLIEAKRVAEAASRAKSEFLANMSHEIRTPMNAILGLTQLVLEGDLEPRQRDFLDKVLVSGKSLLGILNDILDYSKIEAGRMRVESVEMSVEGVLRDVANLFSARIAEKGLELFLDIAPELPDPVGGDPLRLTQVLNNLVGNAVKFTERGEIRVRAEVAGSDETSHTLRFSVHDTGIGLTRDQARQLFQPFTQADGSITRRFGGTGLGLSIAQRLVGLMEGEIVASGIEGQGASFTFTIRVGRHGDGVVAIPGHDLAGLRVLAVDDQATAREIMGNLLLGWGIAAEVCASGEAALGRVEAAEAEGRPYDVLLLDWQMPGIDGLEVARRIVAEREDGETHRPQLIVMVTAHDREALHAEAGALALSGILEKPVSPSGLMDLLMGFVSGSVPPSSPSAESGSDRRRFDGARVLLVEDNEFNRQVAGTMLEKMGIEVAYAHNGVEALAAVTGRPFDLILMDLHMPEMDGLEATRRILALPGRGDTPILAMTAAVMASDRDHCREAGMVDFIAKPFKLADFAATLARWLPGYAANPPALPTPPAAVDLPLVPGVELAAGLERLGGDLPRYRRLLAEWLRQEKGVTEAVAARLAEADLDAARQRLHALKGGAANLGLTAVAERAAGCETELRNGATVALAPLTAAIAAAREGLAGFLEEPGTGTGGRGDPERLRIALTTLAPYLARQELPPDELLADLQAEADGDVAVLIGQLDRFDHDGAAATLGRIAARNGWSLAS